MSRNSLVCLIPHYNNPQGLLRSLASIDAAECCDVLVVDDEVGIRELLSEILSDEGYQVRLAQNADEARQQRSRSRPDLVLLDIWMPDMDGIETCREIREQKGLQDVLIAFLTARSEDYTQIAGFEVGADDYITKPIDRATFLPRIAALLGSRASKAA